MPKLELIYQQSCPKVEEARKRLLHALRRAGLPPEWQEWDRDSTTVPAYARAHGSPTILVNGRDVIGLSPFIQASCCRVYPGNEGLKGVPSVEAIRRALVGAEENPSRSPGRLACAVCWPSYAAALAALGFTDDAPSGRPLTVLLLVLAVSGFARGLKQHGGRVWDALRRYTRNGFSSEG